MAPIVCDIRMFQTPSYTASQSFTRLSCASTRVIPKCVTIVLTCESDSTGCRRSPRAYPRAENRPDVSNIDGFSMYPGVPRSLTGRVVKNPGQLARVGRADSPVTDIDR
ncbi:hypothetical protein [Burkholderia pyrrocinia]|uniref:hypothetical protein n=1 Tax=Burkholderia pyrrocinia TaxID=60550 RepID=UPI0011E4DBCB|nr:hypothetical protein [Burkholderia pyrrocinia]